MNAEKRKVVELFGAALELTTDQERRKFLQAACEGDQELHRKVLALLAAHAEAEITQSMPAASSVDLAETLVAASRHSEGPGTVIDRYKLLEQIGEGGMGRVWIADQIEPVQRRVALKVIKHGMDSGHVLARFEAERQALALMDHANIAKILDAGTTPAGRPYFVMELVKGIPITTFCDEKRLSIRERLELFMPVCQAIQHAHQKGIIHRDIKPSNVLVALYDSKPVPKVIDFGVAKATGQRLTQRTLFTELGALIGTPEYMSPEQAELNQLDIDTRSDIYSLGVLLYELLTGTTPLTHEALRQAAFDEILRRIREDEPPKPSTRLTVYSPRVRVYSRMSGATYSMDPLALAAVSAQRHLQPEQLTKIVRGDLDWIVMKALEKDRNRRYDTANGLAADVQRHLSNEPVFACPPTAHYRLKKFVRKHRAAVAAAAGFLLLLTAATGVSTGLALWANRERARAVNAESAANENAQKAINSEKEGRAVLSFLDKLLATTRPEGGLEHELTLRAALESAEPAIGTSFANQPLAEASIRSMLAGLHRSMGGYDKAEPLFQRALSISEKALGTEHPDTASRLNNLALLYRDMGDYAKAEPLFQRALSISKKALGTEHPDTASLSNNLEAVRSALADKHR